MTRDRARRNSLGWADTWRTALADRPAWADGLLLRRILAGGLAVLALTLVIRGDPAAERQQALVAARDLAPGTVLTAADVRTATRSAQDLPAGALTEISAVTGTTLAGAMRPGEMFTDLRVLGPRLAEVAAGTDDARIVPIRLADPAVAEVLRPGDRVDVVGTGDDRGAVHTLATDAVVVLISTGDGGRASPDPVVLVATDRVHAVAVAGASLRIALTVVFR